MSNQNEKESLAATYQDDDKDGNVTLGKGDNCDNSTVKFIGGKDLEAQVKIMYWLCVVCRQ